MMLDSPIFVLCGGRFGSTLLGNTLDSHPLMACGPEFNFAAVAATLLRFVAMLEGIPVPDDGSEPEYPDRVVARVRQILEDLMASYLAAQGKIRFCEKSLGTAPAAEKLKMIFPDALLVALVRHPLDFLASAMKVSPNGLNGYGFGPYDRRSPGNMLNALALYWIDHVTAILAARERYGLDTFILRYEDLVRFPQFTVDRLLEFADMPLVPDIRAAVFSYLRHRKGPADGNFWYTSGFSTKSLGRGWTVDVSKIRPDVQERMWALCRRLGYLVPDKNWGGADQPASFCVPGTSDGEPGSAGAPAAGLPDPAVVELVGQRLEAGLSSAGPDFAGRWGQSAQDVFDVVISPDGPGVSARWTVDAGSRTLTAVTGPGVPPVSGDAVSSEDAVSGDAVIGDAGGDRPWQIVGAAGFWAEIMDGDLNMAEALRFRQLRYFGTAGGIVLTRTRMLTELLGVTSWRAGQDNAPPPPEDGPGGSGHVQR